MIDIRNGAGVSLLLTPGTRLTTETLAGWLTDDDWPAGFSYPIKFPLCEQNERFLSPAYRLGSAIPIMSLPVTVSLAGMLYRQCTLDYRFTNNEGDGFLKIDGGEIYASVKNLTLQQAVPDVLSLSTAFALPALMLQYARAAPLLYPCTFFPIRNDGFFEADAPTKLPGFVAQPYVNAWNGAAFTTEFNGVTGSPVVPQFYLVWVLERILKGIGYKLGGSWPALASTRKKVLLNLTALELSPTVTPKGGLFPLVTSTLADHLPTMNVGDFFKALRLRFGLLILFDSTTRTCLMHQYEQVVADPDALDLTPYVGTTWNLDDAPRTGLALEESLDSADELWKVVGRSGSLEAPAASPFLVGPGRADATRKTVSIPVAPVQQTLEDIPVRGGKWLIPTVRQKGNHRGNAYSLSDVAPTETGELRQSTSLRVLDYQGLQADSLGRFYPCATAALALDGRQQPIAGASALSVSAELTAGLGGYYTVRDAGRPATLPVTLPVALLNRLTGEKPLRVSLDKLGLNRLLLTRLRAESPGSDGLCVGSVEALELPVGGLSGPVITQPVYVELLSLTMPFALSGERFRDNASAPMPYYDLGDRTRLTVRCWQDAAKTIPANVQGLRVTVRRKRTQFTVNVGSIAYNPSQPYEETLLSYPVSGASTVIEVGWITAKKTRSRGEVQVLYNPLFTTTWQLELADGYRILPTVPEYRAQAPGYVYNPAVLGPS